MPTTFVLVHGAFGSPAELAPVVPYLEELGHRVVNVDLPCERAGSTLEDYADAVVRAMDGIPHPRVLVAHSAGGATIPLVAAQVPAERLVYVAAVVPEPGQSISAALGPEAVEAIGAVTIDNGDGTRSFNIDLLASFAPPEEREAYVAFLNGTQRRQGWPAVNQPWPGGGRDPGPPARLCPLHRGHDHPPERQRAFAALLGVSPIEIASVHAAFAFRPRELAGVLATLAA